MGQLGTCSVASVNGADLSIVLMQYKASWHEQLTVTSIGEVESSALVLEDPEDRGSFGDLQPLSL